MQPTEDTRHCQRFIVVGNNQGVVFKLYRGFIKQRQGFTCIRHAYINTAFNRSQVECVHRVPKFKQYEVGYVYNRVDAANTTTAQFFCQPQG